MFMFSACRSSGDMPALRRPRLAGGCDANHDSAPFSKTKNLSDHELPQVFTSYSCSLPSITARAKPMMHRTTLRQRQENTFCSTQELSKHGPCAESKTSKRRAERCVERPKKAYDEAVRKALWHRGALAPSFIRFDELLLIRRMIDD